MVSYAPGALAEGGGKREPREPLGGRTRKRRHSHSALWIKVHPSVPSSLSGLKDKGVVLQRPGGRRSVAANPGGCSDAVQDPHAFRYEARRGGAPSCLRSSEVRASPSTHTRTSLAQRAARLKLSTWTDQRLAGAVCPGAPARP